MKAYLKYLNINDIQNIELSYLNLPTDIRKHVRSKYNDLHFKQSVIAWSLFFELVKKHLAVDNIEIEFSENGKPFVKDNLFYFSISHSSNYVAIVISSVNIGVDVQEMKRNRDYDYLCKLEVAAKLKDQSIFKCKEEDTLGIFYYNFDLIQNFKLLVGSYSKLEIEVL
jgi:phosphopantetheinyl transferase